MRNKTDSFDQGQRVNWVDYCRGIEIIFVVAGHVLGGLQASGIVEDSYKYKFIESWLYTFHMPLFFFISGLFVRRSVQKSLPMFVLDKAGVLVYPYFIWSILQGMLDTSHYVNHPLPLIELMKIPYEPINQFWFLYTLFVIMIIYGVFFQIFSSSISFFVLAILCFIVEQAGLNSIQWTVAHDVGAFLVYFGAGVAIAQTSILARLAKQGNAALLAVCIGGYAGVTIGVATHSAHQAIFWAGWAMAGIIATVSLAILISRSAKFGFIKLWGLLSLEIYVAHVMAAAAIRIVLQRVFGISSPSLHLLLGIAVGMYAPIVLAYVCQRVGLPYVFTLSGSRPRPWGGRSMSTPRQSA